jgi:TetR/AcrR family transcriptional regulator, cholesterol catabolism regulator
MNITNDTAIRIFQQAHLLFMQYGLKSVSMDDIASKMGISKKTIYQFYADKEALVAEVVKQITSNNQLQCDNDISNSENAIHEIILAMEQMSKLFETMNPSILFDLQKYYPQAFKFFQAHKNDYVFGKIKQNINRGINEGLYRDDLNIEIVSRYRVESIVIAFNPEFQSSVKSSLVSIAQELSTFFLYGVVNEKGYKLINKYAKNRSKK